MIRVIEETPDPSAVKRVVCYNCGVKLEYTRSDTKRKTVRDYGGGSDTYSIVTCPRCNNEISV